MSLAALHDPAVAGMPGEYYAAVSSQSPAGAESGATMMPTGVLRKQGQSTESLLLV